MKKKIFGMLTCVVVTLMLFFGTRGATSEGQTVLFTSSFDVDYVSSDSSVSMKVSASSDEGVNLATFKATFHFDSSKIKFKGITASDRLDNNEFKTHVTTGEVVVIYLTSESGLNVSRETELFEVEFKALKDIPIGEVTVEQRFDGVGNYSVKEVLASYTKSIPILIIEEPDFDCRIRSIMPPDGLELDPEFSSDTYDYTMVTPNDIKSIEFDVTAINEETIINQKKRKLNKAGEETDIAIYAYSPDRKIKKVYHIVVVRDEKVLQETFDNDKNTITSKSKDNIKGNVNGDTKHKGFSTDEVISNSIDTVTEPTKLVIRQNGFNIYIFIVVIVICAGVWGFITYRWR